MNEVLIIEDHPVFADGTREILSRHYPILNITVRESAEAALDALVDPSKAWQRIFLDLGVPGAHGLSLAKRIYDQGFGPITCVVSGHDRQDFVAQIRSMGFLGYIAKTSPKERLSSALFKVLAGERFFPPTSNGIREEGKRLTRKQVEMLNYVRNGFSSKLISVKRYRAFPRRVSVSPRKSDELNRNSKPHRRLTGWHLEAPFVRH
jgi:DNA-binding NarL/FixJ family response regulator